MGSSASSDHLYPVRGLSRAVLQRLLMDKTIAAHGGASRGLCAFVDPQDQNEPVLPWGHRSHRRYQRVCTSRAASSHAIAKASGSRGGLRVNQSARVMQSPAVYRSFVPTAAIVAALAGGLFLTLLTSWRARVLHARGSMARVGLPRSHRRGFVSRRDVRRHLSASVPRVARDGAWSGLMYLGRDTASAHGSRAAPRTPISCARSTASRQGRWCDHPQPS